MAVREYKARIKSDISGGYWASSHRGEIVDIHENGSTLSFSINGGPKSGVNRDHFEEIRFTPTSGMTFLDDRGQYGLFVQVGDDLVMMFQEGKSYNGYSIYSEDRLGNTTTKIRINEIYDGMHTRADLALNHNLGKTSTKVLWSRKPKTTEVVLTNSYTAIVSKDTITVGCQEIPLSKVKEVIAAAEKL